MKKKFFLLLSVLFVLQHCNFSPIYSNKNNFNLEIEVLNLDGDSEMNNMVLSNFKKYSNNESKKKFKVNVKTWHDKEILLKNKAGEVTSYLIKNKINFEIININSNKNYSFSTETKAASKTNEFDFNQYERSLKKNFVNTKIQELILNLSNLDDS